MPFEIVRNDITNMIVDAIVNTANPRPVIGAGVDACIHGKAGPQLLAAREEIGRIAVGQAAITPGFDLPARFVIHTVGPVWRGGLLGEARQLRSCYEASLALALEHQCRSVAFPLICAGTYGFPRDKALQIAMDAIRSFLAHHEMKVYLVVFDRDSFRLSQKRFREVSSFIDEHYVQEKSRGTDDAAAARRRIQEDARYGAPMASRPTDACQAPEPMEAPKSAPMPAPKSAPPRPAPRFSAPMSAAPMERPSAAAPKQSVHTGEKPSLAQLLEKTDAGFSETLLKLIDSTGKKDSDIYTRANISRQHFSKIRNNPFYQPTKATAIAFAIALELDLEQTQDLIGRAGFALTNSSKFDVIVMYFIRQRNYDLFDINAALFEFDQNLLGA